MRKVQKVKTDIINKTWRYGYYAYFWIALVELLAISLVALTGVQWSGEKEPGATPNTKQEHAFPRDLSPFDKIDGGWDGRNHACRFILSILSLVVAVFLGINYQCPACGLIVLAALVPVIGMGIASFSFDVTAFNKAKDADCTNAHCEQAEYAATVAFSLIVPILAIGLLVVILIRLCGDRTLLNKANVFRSGGGETEATSLTNQTPTHTTTLTPKTMASPFLNAAYIILTVCFFVSSLILLIFTILQHTPAVQSPTISLTTSTVNYGNNHQMPRNVYLFNEMKAGDNIIKGGWRTLNNVWRLVTCIFGILCVVLLLRRKSTLYCLLFAGCYGVLSIFGFIAFGLDVYSIGKARNEPCPVGYSCSFAAYWAVVILDFYVGLWPAAYVLAQHVFPHVYRVFNNNPAQMQKANGAGSSDQQQLMGIMSAAGGNTEMTSHTHTGHYTNNYTNYSGVTTQHQHQHQYQQDSTNYQQQQGQHLAAQSPPTHTNGNTTGEVKGTANTTTGTTALTTGQSPTHFSQQPESPQQEAPRAQPQPSNHPSPQGFSPQEASGGEGITGFNRDQYRHTTEVDEHKTTFEQWQVTGAADTRYQQHQPVQSPSQLAPPPPDLLARTQGASPASPFRGSSPGTHTQEIDNLETADSMALPEDDETQDSMAEPDSPRSPYNFRRPIPGGDPFVGVMLEDEADPRDGQIRATVVSINEGGPADEGDLQVDDVITKFDGKPVSCKAEFGHYLNHVAIGSQVVVEVYRQSSSGLVDCEIVVQERDPLSSPWAYASHNRSRSLLAR